MSEYWENCGCESCTSRREEIKAAKAAASSRVLTRATVEEYGPCYECSSRFEERFPESVNVTVELALSQSSDWDWWWAADNLLTAEGYETFRTTVHEMENEYDKQMEPYQKAWADVRNSSYETYDKILRQEQASGKTYNESYRIANAWWKDTTELPQAALAAAREVVTSRMRKIEAKTWAEIYISEEGTELPPRYRDDSYDENEDY